MPKGSSKNTAIIQRLLEERRQYQAWIARLGSAEDATPEPVRVRVKADYEARLKAVTEELRSHADSARQAIEQKKHIRAELQKKEALAAEKLSETELRHAVGEYDEAQWSQVHKDALAELVSIREELEAIEGEIEKLQELTVLVRKPEAAAALSASDKPLPKVGPPPKPKADEKKKEAVDELAFIKSVTEDEKGGAPSPKRASGAQFQPAVPATTPHVAPTPRPAPAAPPAGSADEAEAPKTLKCKECGTMNAPTEWYCEQCGAELAAV